MGLSLKRMAQSLLFILVSVWALLSLLLYLFQPKFVYLPSKDIAATPDTIGLSYEEVILTTSGDVNISGWYLPHPQAKSTMLFLHGNGGNISHRLEKLMIFHELGLTVFIIDYQGYEKFGLDELLNIEHILEEDIIKRKEGG